MPAKSKAQLELMQAVEHSPKFAKKVGIKPEVAKKFTSTPAKGLPERVKKRK
jgi:hypothetical protein